MAAPIVVTIARTNLDIKSMASLHENDVVWIGLNKESHIGRLEPFGSNQLIGRFSTLSGHQTFNPKNAQEL